ncbi:MAG: prephenate dehydratase domain-containing protein, partial [Acidimicrobiia bacterium]
MRIGYQGEAFSYSHRATTELFPGDEPVGLHTFVACFAALEAADVDRLVLPVENSTTGSVLPVLDRLPAVAGRNPFSIVREHLVEVRHALMGLPGASLEGVKRVKSHPQALAQAEALLLDLGVDEIPTHDTAGAVREVASSGD